MNSLANNIYNYSKGKLNRMKRGLDREIKSRLNKLGQRTVEQLKSFTKVWYDTYSPTSYVRTNDFINSVTYKVENNRVYIYFDVSKIKSVSSDGGWNTHRGFDGIDFREGLIDWIENDKTNSGIQSNPRKTHNGVYMIKNTQEWLQDYLDSESERIVDAVVQKYLE